MNNTLYVRSTDVFEILMEIRKSKIEKYKENFSLIEWDDLEKAKNKILLYIPKGAVDFLNSKEIKINKTSVLSKEGESISKNGEMSLNLHNIPREEHIKKYLSCLGKVLNDYSPDINVDFSEYQNLISFLLEYLYLKDLNKESEFKKEHLYKLLVSAKKYLKLYSKYYDDLLSMGKKITKTSSEIDIQRIEDSMTNRKIEFVEETGFYLSKLSSLDVTLTIANDIDDPEDFQSILALLINNKDHNRSKIINDLGISSYNFNSIRKELKMR